MSTRPNYRRHLPVRQNEEAEKRETALRNAFVNVSSAIGCRPESVRSRMDKAASDGRRPWKGFAETLRANAIDAAQMDRATQDATEKLIVDAILALTHYVLEPLDCRLIGEVTYLGVSNELSEAVEAITDAKFQPTPENIAKADRESAEAARALQLHQGGMRRTHNYVRPMGCSPAPLEIA